MKKKRHQKIDFLAKHPPTSRRPLTDITKMNPRTKTPAQKKPTRKKPTKKRWIKLLAAASIILLLSMVSLAGQAVVSNDGFGETISRLPLIGNIGKLIGAGNKKVKKTRDGRTNILILGMGGAGHEGPLLTDTIMVLSVHHDLKKAGLISIPRDLLVPIPGNGHHKVNAANAYGEAQKEGSGPGLVAQSLEEVLDIPMHYYVRVDFESFETIIDELGGIDIYVRQSFTDPFFPSGPNQHQTVSFTKGNHHFDGATALKYARSRYTTSDFDRALRQQDILNATKDKALRLETWLNPTKVFSIWRTVEENVVTNLSQSEIQGLLGLLPELQTENIAQIVFTDAPDNYLYATYTEDGAFVLMPKGDTYDALAFQAKHLFDDEVAPVPDFTPPEIAGEPGDEQYQGIPRITIHNGTRTAGLASRAATLLEDNGFDVVGIGNADEHSHSETVIYDLTQGSRLTELAFLKGILDARIAQIVTPAMEDTFAGDDIDFYIILGQ